MATGIIAANGGQVATRFLDTADIAAIFRREGAAALFSRLADCIREDYLRWEDFDKSPRVGKYSPFGVIELMPIADQATYSFKFVNGHPGNPRRGLPTVMAFGALADVETGAVRLISELTLTTALRTAAASALFASVLARPDSRSMALIGNGAQADFQALAFHHLVGIEEIRLFDIDGAATDKLLRNLGSAGIRFKVCDSVAQAVRGADIVTTLTAEDAHTHVLRADMIEPGMHINAVGGDSPGKTELDPDILHMGPVFVEYEPQTRVEGELQNQPPDFPVTPFWKVLRGQDPGRTSPGQVTVYDSVGFALEDYSALRYVRDMACKFGLGRTLMLVPTLEDPKDVFGLTRVGSVPDIDGHAGEKQSCEKEAALPSA